MNIDKWDLRFFKLSEEIASWSKDPSTKCGSVIIRPDKTIASLGYNGHPRGCLDDKKYYNDKKIKYSRIIHSELNAILNCYEKPIGYTLYCNNPPCDRCSSTIIQSGIICVKYLTNIDLEERWKEQLIEAKKMMQEAKLSVFGYDRYEYLTDIKSLKHLG